MSVSLRLGATEKNKAAHTRTFLASGEVHPWGGEAEGQQSEGSLATRSTENSPGSGDCEGSNMTHGTRWQHTEHGHAEHRDGS